MTDFQRTVMRQYANSTTLMALLESFDEWVDPAQFTADFLAKVWDISSAVSFGLDIWGRILGQDRYLQVQQTPGNNFGFDIGDQTGTQWKPWNQAPFYDGSERATAPVRLPDSTYRNLLLVKAAANIADATAPSLNALLRAMFSDRGRAYVTYDLDAPMRIAFHFEFVPTNVERAIIATGLFPAPAGVAASYIFAD